MSPIDVAIFFGILVVMLLLAFAIVSVIVEMLYIAWKLLWLVIGIPYRLLRTFRRRIL